MSNKEDGKLNSQSANVVQLGFNISVSGDPGTDFQIVLDDSGQKTVQSSAQNELQPSDILQIKDSSTKLPKHEVENTKLSKEVKPAEATGAILKQSRQNRKLTLSETFNVNENESSTNRESSIIDDIKSTMEHFEKFSDHIKEIPRLKSHPIATSTPFPDKQNSRSETNMIYPEHRSRRFAHLYDFQSRKDYFKGSVKPLPPDLFLKPLPGEDFYKRGIVTRYFDLEPHRHYGSIDGLNKTSTAGAKSKYDESDLSNEPPSGILKKSDSESGDKLSTSSADSVKDIKIYQSGGILIMQNFKDSMDVGEKKEISDFSAKLIENCNKLKEEINAGFPNPEDKLLVGNSSDDYKNSGKMVQFDLSGFENRKSKSGDSISNVQKDDSSSAKLESSGSTSDCVKNKDSSPQGTSQSQDFPSFSTQENDSFISNQPGMSPTYGTTEKKLEWDSGADVGYLNLDLSKENLSTIERIVLKGLSSDGVSEKKVVYEKKPEQPKTNRSKFILERMPSELLAEEIIEANKKLEAENKEKSSTERKKHDSKGEKQETGQRREEIPPKELSKDENQSKEPKLNKEKGLKEPPKNESLPEEIKPKQKAVESTDKSVNVNTLFKDAEHQVGVGDYRQIESPTKFKSSRLSPKVRKFKKKKVPNQRTNLTAPLKDKIDSIIDIARCSGKSKDVDLSGMGIPKRVYRKLEANPELKEVELSREVEEIIIDQRFKIKQNVSVEREVVKESPTTATTGDGDSRKDTKTKNRPISASSGSNNTVLPNTEGKGEDGKNKTAEPSKFSDQIIQTNESVIEVESIGIQAFASLKSRECDIRRKDQPLEVPKVWRGEAANMSSKNIQAYGLNSSLPKQLAHPKGNQLVENQNTKSTQFFGGPINSLPNYHSNLITKPVESCSHMPKVLKTQKSTEAEIIRLREENEKNIMANEDLSTNSELKPRKQSSDAENKENLISEKSTNSKKSQIEARKSSKGNGSYGGSQESRKNAKGNEICDSKVQAQTETLTLENSDCFRVSDDVSSKFLTSEVLREHGHSIDRNIIKEKYFQSQLIEIEKREMRPESTSLERVDDKNGKMVTVGCQYSPQSKESTENIKERGNYVIKEKKNRKRKETSEKCDSSQNFMEEPSETLNQGTGDSVLSSTQTANSWIPAMRDSGQNNGSGVGRARSFEYLPGHMYESSGNLREELPSDPEQNVVTCSSSGFSNSEKVLSSDGLKDSEGRTTLVLENSTAGSHDSGPMKILNENLTQLNLVVSKLWEKDAQIQSVTQSLLVNLWNGGSGDCMRDLETTDNPKTEVIDKKDIPNGHKQRKGSGDMFTPTKSVEVKAKDQNEISIGCQTEEKTSRSEPEKIYEERKALEKRISQEKESQIKWIENEIYQLNILRGLLEKQGYSSQRKKKRSSATLTDETHEKEEKYQKNILAEVHPRPVTPIYGCTVSFSDTKSPEENPSRDENSSPPAEETGNHSPTSDALKYGMAVSLTSGCNTLRRMIVLPVGVQVSLKDKNLAGQRSEYEYNQSFRRPSGLQSPLAGYSDNLLSQYGFCKHQRNPCNDANTQCPSVRGNFPSTSIQTDFPGIARCCRCQLENCVCLELSEKSHQSPYRSSRSRSSSKTRDREKNYGTNEGNDGIKTSTSCTEVEPLEMMNPSSSKPYESGDKFHRSRSSSPGIFHKERVVPVLYCKCENCPSRVSSRAVEQSPRALNNGSSCQSNIYLNCDKSNEDIRPCSKVHVQKSSGCACHIIKIHGIKCCLAESGSGSGVSRRQSKKMENQCCQTNDVLVVPKDQRSSYDEENRPKTPQEREFPMPSQHPIGERCPCQRPKRPGSARSSRQEKVSVEVQTHVTSCNCSKKKKSKEKSKEKSKADDHPRHYFLKIEETEMDDSNESVERRKSLEVITVTVPVKKGGKAKISEKKSEHSSLSEQCSVDSLNACKCCEKCLGRLYAQQFDTQGDAEPRKNKTEKPGRSRKPYFHQPIDSLPEVDDPCMTEPLNRDGYKPMYNQSSTVMVYSQDQDEEYKRPGFFYPSEFWSSNPEDRDRPTRDAQLDTVREIPSDYDSHKEWRNQSNICYENGRYSDRRQNPEQMFYGGNRYKNDAFPQGFDYRPQMYRGSDRYPPDYYNYDKREFLTKSELIREKEKSRRDHQPNLQESLLTNRPDFYNSAENRRQLISERAKERSKKHQTRVESLIRLMQGCGENDRLRSGGPKRVFTSLQMREQTMKRYKNLPEVTEKIADQKKKEEYRTNKLMADIFSKKLQLEALKGGHPCSHENQ